MFDNLTEDNFLLYCAKAYDKPNSVMKEFNEDLQRINYLIRLFIRYKRYGNIRERLILNHLVVLYNVFGVDAATRMLFYKVPEEHYSVLKTFLVLLSVMPDTVIGINGRDIKSSDILLDEYVVKILRNLIENGKESS